MGSEPIQHDVEADLMPPAGEPPAEPSSDEPWFTWRTPVERWLEEKVYRPVAGWAADQLDFATYDIQPPGFGWQELTGLMAADPETRRAILRPVLQSGNKRRGYMSQDPRLAVATSLADITTGYVAPAIEDRLRRYAAGDPYAFSVGDELMRFARWYGNLMRTRRERRRAMEQRKTEAMPYEVYRQRMQKASPEEEEMDDLETDLYAEWEMPEADETTMTDIPIDEFDDPSMYAEGGREMSDAMKKLLGYGSQAQTAEPAEEVDDEKDYELTKEIIDVYPGVKLGSLNGKIAVWKNTLRGRWMETFDNYTQARKWLEQNQHKLAQR
jgi:hypothetical protein